MPNAPKVQHLAKTEDALTLFGRSYDLVKENSTVFIFVYSVPGLFALWSFLSQISGEHGTNTYSGFFSSFPGLHFNTPTGAGVTLSLVLGVLAVVFGLLQTILTLRVAQGRKPSFSSIWEEFKKKGWRLLGLEIMMGIGIIVGLILLIVPGVILFWRWFLAPYILIDKNTPISEALVQSWELTKGYAWPIYSVILLGVVFALTERVPIVGVIASTLLAIAYSVAPALRYRELNRRSV